MSNAPASCSTTLGEAASQAETGFLAAGRCLEDAIQVLDRLTRRFADYIDGLTGEALDATRHDLATAGDHIAGLAELHHTDAAALEALAAIVTATEHRVTALQPIPEEVEILSLSARIVAGGMGEAAADFVAFSLDIRDAAQQARSCLTEASGSLSAVDRELTAARHATTLFAERHAATLQAIPARLAQNMRCLTNRQQLAAAAAGVAHNRSEEVCRQVAAQIVALQLGDITRQRIEHVQDALSLTARPCGTVTDLLAAQLTDAADELAREGERIDTGLHQLGQAARAIGELGASVHGETDDGGFIGALEADIRQTAALFVELSTGDAAADKRMSAVLTAAADLSSRLLSVQSVQEDIRIMGLNATLKCARLGTMGRPLAATAQELRLCSGRFGANAASVLQDLERLRAIATRLRDPSRRDRHAELAQATDDMLAPLQRLGRVGQELAQALAQLRDDADTVGRLVTTAVAQFAVRHTLAMTLREAASELAASPRHETAEAADLLDRIAAGYTMAREREVHARFAPLPQEAAPTELADILF